MLLKSILCNSIFNLLIFMFSTFLIFKAMFGFSEKIIKKSFIDEKFLVKNSLSVYSLAVCLSPTLSAFLPRILQVHYIGLQSENHSLLIKHSVSFTIWLFFQGLRSAKFLFLFLSSFCFSVLKEDLPVVQRMLTFLQNLKCQAENIHFSSLTKII